MWTTHSIRFDPAATRWSRPCSWIAHPGAQRDVAVVDGIRIHHDAEGGPLVVRIQAHDAMASEANRATRLDAHRRPYAAVDGVHVVDLICGHLDREQVLASVLRCWS